MDRHLIAYMLLHTKYGKSKLVHAALKKLPEIKEIHEVYGRYDLIIKIETDSLSELKAFIQNKMWLSEGVTYAETLIANDIENGDTTPLTDFDDDSDDSIPN